jgi:hypothetical protein
VIDPPLADQELYRLAVVVRIDAIELEAAGRSGPKLAIRSVFRFPSTALGR